MSLLGNAIKKGREGTPKENPLVTLGFGSRIVELLSAEELFGFVQSMAKAVLLKIHSDQTGGGDEHTQAVVEAMKALRDRVAFDKAFEEFRRERSARRRELSSNLEALAKEKERVKELEARVSQLTREREEARNIETEGGSMVVKLIRSLTVRVRSNADVADIANCAGVRFVQVLVGNTHHSPIQIDIDKLREEAKDKFNPSKHLEEHRVVARSEITARFRRSKQGTHTLPLGIDEALATSEHFPEVHWDLGMAQKLAGLTDVAFCESPEVMSYEQKLAGAPHQAKWYRDALVVVKNTSGSGFLDEFHLEPKEYPLNRGVLTLNVPDSSGQLHFAVLGVVGEKESGPLFGEGNTFSGLAEVSEEWLALRLSPLLYRGGLLVGSEVQGFSWAGGEGGQQKTVERALRKPHKFFVLGVIYDFVS
ncbi:MAG TPA: hypothetical protein VJG48_00750 [Candidatus Paceibacterota bacterium]